MESSYPRGGVRALLVVTTLPPQREPCVVACAANVLLLISLEAGYPLRRWLRLDEAGSIVGLSRAQETLIVADGHSIWGVDGFLRKPREVAIYRAVHGSLGKPMGVAAWDFNCPLFFRSPAGLCRADRDSVHGSWTFIGRKLELPCKALVAECLEAHADGRLLVAAVHPGTVATSRILVFTGRDLEDLVLNLAVTRGPLRSVRLRALAASDDGSLFVVDSAGFYRIHGVLEATGKLKRRARPVEAECADCLLLDASSTVLCAVGDYADAAIAEFRGPLEGAIAVYHAADGEPYVITAHDLLRPVTFEAASWTCLLAHWLVRDYHTPPRPRSRGSCLGIDLCLPKAKRDPQHDMFSAVFDPNVAAASPPDTAMPRTSSRSSGPLTPIPEEGEDEKSLGP